MAILNTFVQVAACMGPTLFVGVLSSRAAASLAQGMSAAASQAMGFSAAVALACAIALVGLAVSLVYTRPRPADDRRD